MTFSSSAGAGLDDWAANVGSTIGASVAAAAATSNKLILLNMRNSNQ